MVSLRMWAVREAAIRLANGLQDSALIFLPSAKPVIPLITIHSMSRSCAAAYTPKNDFMGKKTKMELRADSVERPKSRRETVKRTWQLDLRAWIYRRPWRHTTQYRTFSIKLRAFKNKWELLFILLLLRLRLRLPLVVVVVVVLLLLLLLLLYSNSYMHINMIRIWKGGPRGYPYKRSPN